MCLHVLEIIRGLHKFSDDQVKLKVIENKFSNDFSTSEFKVLMPETHVILMGVRGGILYELKTPSFNFDLRVKRDDTISTMLFVN